MLVSVHHCLLCVCRRLGRTQLCYLSFSADGLHRLLHMSPICPFRRMVCYTCLLFVLFGGWFVTHVSYLSFSADGLRGRNLSFCVYTFWRMVCTCCAFGEWSAHTNDPAPCTLHCLRPDSIPYTLGCPYETSTLKLFGLICGPCHQKGERLHTGTGQEHNSYPCLPLP